MLVLSAPEAVDAVSDKLFEALALLVIAIVVSVTNRINNRPIKKKLDETDQKIEESRSKVDQVRSTLTENNGGSTVKDSLDKIMRTQEIHGMQFKYLESQQDNIQAKQDRLETKQDRHEAKVDAIDKKVNDHIFRSEGKHPYRRRKDDK